MEYKFEEEQKAIEGKIRKIKVISVLLTGRNLVPIRPTPEFTKKLIYDLWEEVDIESFLLVKHTYHLCDSLYIENRNVVAYLGKNFVGSYSEKCVIEEIFYTLFNTTLPELFFEYKSKFSRCYDILVSSERKEGIEMFFDLIDELVEDNKLEISVGKLEKAKEEINKVIGYDYLEFTSVFSNMVFGLFEEYIDIDKVYKDAAKRVWDRMEDLMEDIKRRLNELSNDIVHFVEYANISEIRIMFNSSYELYKPNFTSLLYEIEDILGDCITTLKEEFERITSVEEITDNLSYRKPKDALIIDFIDMFSEGKPINEEDIMSTCAVVLLRLPTFVDKVYPTDLSLKICDLLKEIRGG